MNNHRPICGFTLLECLAALALILLLLGTVFSLNGKIGEEQRAAALVDRIIQLVVQNSRTQPQQILTLKVVNDGDRTRLETEGEVYQLPQNYAISHAIDTPSAVMLLRFQNGRQLFQQPLYLIQKDTRNLVRKW